MRYCNLLLAIVVSLLAWGQLAAQQKAPIPDTQAQAPAKKAAAEVYGDRFAAARTDAQKTALASEILAAAGKIQSGSVDQYVLLSIARDIAARGGDVELALQAVEQMTQHFEVGAIKLKTEAIENSARRHASTTNQHRAVAEVAEGLIDNLAAAEDYPTAARLCELAESAAKKAREYRLANDLRSRLADLKRQEAASRDYRQATATLEKDPTDAPANLAAERYRCFVKGDWPMACRGTPMTCT